MGRWVPGLEGARAISGEAVEPGWPPVEGERGEQTLGLSSDGRVTAHHSY